MQCGESRRAEIQFFIGFRLAWQTRSARVIKRWRRLQLQFAADADSQIANSQYHPQRPPHRNAAHKCRQSKSYEQELVLRTAMLIFNFEPEERICECLDESVFENISEKRNVRHIRRAILFQDIYPRFRSPRFAFHFGLVSLSLDPSISRRGLYPFRTAINSSIPRGSFSRLGFDPIPMEISVEMENIIC